MCGVWLTNNDRLVSGLMGHIIQHRGHDSSITRHFKGMFLGLNRLAIVDQGDAGTQPLVTGASVIAFNGEIYNQNKLGEGSEIVCIERLMRQYPQNFERFLDGYYAIVRIDKGRERVILSRDPIGVVPLFYRVYAGEFSVCSETKAFPDHNGCKEVKPGETIEFDFSGRIMKRRRYEPVSLHMEPMHLRHLEFLFTRAVARRVRHADNSIRTTIALSGGLDSALVLAAAMHSNSRNLDCITIAMDWTDPHVARASKLAAHYRVDHHIVVLTKQEIEWHWPMIVYHLGDMHPNPIKYAAMIRNYFVAKYTNATVILCGEGADELGGGYPSHAGLSGLQLQWKCFSTLRSMHAINLDRVNNGGMAFTKEYRVPFLDRAVVQYMMGCEKEAPGKQAFRALADLYGLPDYVTDQPKYNVDDARFRTLARDLLNQLHPSPDPSSSDLTDPGGNAPLPPGGPSGPFRDL